MLVYILATFAGALYFLVETLEGDQDKFSSDDVSVKCGVGSRSTSRSRNLVLTCSKARDAYGLLLVSVWMCFVLFLDRVNIVGVYYSSLPGGDQAEDQAQDQELQPPSVSSHETTQPSAGSSV